MREARHARRLIKVTAFAAVAVMALAGCRNSMPHAFTWPYSGDQNPSHPKPPEGGYYKNWDPYAVSLEVTPLEDVNPVRTQHVLVATVRDKDGKPLPNRRVEWIISKGSVGDIVEVDESGWRASRGYKVGNDYAVSHTNNGPHVLDRGNDDPSDDVQLTEGQTWCTITSPVEGDTYITVYCPGIYDWGKHKVFAVKHWYDIKWDCPPPSTNPVGTTHTFVTTVTKYSDGTYIPGHMVTYKIMDGPPASFEGGTDTITVPTDAQGQAKATIRQAAPAAGTNNVSIEIFRPENTQCCKPGVKIATCQTSKTWIAPSISCNKTGTASALVGQDLQFQISVNNPSQVDATDVIVTDNMPDGLSMVSSNPPSSGGSWNLGTLKAGETKTVSITAKGNRSGTFENCAEVRAGMGLSTRCCTRTTIAMPALAIEKKCPAEALLCEPFEYLVIVRNTGDGMATNVRMQDNLPDGLATTTGRNSVTANIGDLRPGEAKQVRFQVKATRAGRYDNTAQAMADGGLTAQASCSTNVVQPVLQITKTGPELRFIGRPAQFDITVTNSGSTPARNTVLVDPLPAGWQYISASDGGSESGGRVTWNLGTMDPGATKKVSVNLKAMSKGAGKNTATVTAVCGEAVASASTEIKGLAGILLEVIDQDDPIEINGTETYTIVVTNQGSDDLTNCKINATIPDHMSFVSAGGATTGTASGVNVTFAPLPSLAPKSRATWTVVTKGIDTAGNDTADVRFKVLLTGDQLTTPVEETESTHIYE